MKPLLVSHSDSAGGAARAAYRLQRALVAAAVPSRMRVASKASGDWHVAGPASPAAKAWELLRTRLAQQLLRMQRTSNPLPHSPAVIPTRLARRLDSSDADVINLHWIGGEMLSISDIGRIRKPVVWTMHDSWAFCGTEHHPDGLDDQRYAEGYTPRNRRPGHGGLDLDAWAWRRKRRAWRRPFTVVTPSRWLADCARRSVLMRDWPIHVIPNVLPVDVYRPWPQDVARSAFGLPHDARIVLFGAVGGTSSAKGWSLLAQALPLVAQALPGAMGVVVGQAEPRDPPRVGMPLRFIGTLSDDVALAMLYSASDVVVLPSRLENLPQSGTEAQACGVPVVAFDCSGLPDVVAHRETGFLARPYDATDLGAGIIWTLENSQRLHELGRCARERALSIWAPGSVVARYLDVYQEAIEMARVQR